MTDNMYNYISTYTILGYYDDTNQIFQDEVLATCPFDAMRKCASEHKEDAGNLVFIGAIKGPVEMQAPADDNDKAVYAIDLVEED